MQKDVDYTVNSYYFKVVKKRREADQDDDAGESEDDETGSDSEEDYLGSDDDKK